MAITASRFTDMLLPGLNQAFKDGYRGTVRGDDTFENIIWDPIHKIGLEGLPDNMSYDEIADAKEAGKISNLVPIYPYAGHTDKPVTVTFDFDTKGWTAVLQDVDSR